MSIGLPQSKTVSQIWIGALLIVIGVLSGDLAGQASPLGKWHWRNPLPAGNDLQSVTYGKGMFVTVDAFGGILSSYDGVEWRRSTSEIPAILEAVTYGDELFVAVGWDSIILTSRDAMEWTPRRMETEVYLNGVAYGNGRFVAVGSKDFTGWIATSNDGVGWTTQGLEDISVLYGVAYAKGVFVAVGFSYDFVTDLQETRLVTSVDGVTWVKRDVGTRAVLHSVTYGNGRFVAVGDSYFLDNALIVSSQNGVDWAVQDPLLSYNPDYWRVDLQSVTYGNGRFVAVGFTGNGDLLGTWMSSSNGVFWEIEAFPDGYRQVMVSVAAGNGKFVAVGWYGFILTSTNGSDWSNQLQGFYADTWDLSAIAASTNALVTLGHNGILGSTNGIDWIEPEPTDEALTYEDVIYAHEKFVAVGHNRFREGFIRSGNGITWTNVACDGELRLYGIAYGNGTFVAVGGECSGESGSATSSDGQQWARHDAGVNGILRAVAFGDGMFVAVGSGHLECPDYSSPPLVSADGANWTPLGSNRGHFGAVAYGNGRFVLADWDEIWVSLDGISLTYQTRITTPVKKLVYANGAFFALGSGKPFMSSDGSVWTPSYIGASIASLTYAMGSYFAVGSSGALLQSDLTPPFERSFGLALRLTQYPELILSGGSNRAFRIESRTDTSRSGSWQALTNLYPMTNPYYWRDEHSPPFQQRFYRAVLLP